MNKVLIFIILVLPIPIYAQMVLGDPNAIVYSMDIQTQNKLLVAILNQEKVELWNYENKTLLKNWQLDSRGNAVAIANNIIVVAKSNGAVDMYDALTFEKIKSQKLTEGIPLIDLKIVSRSIFVLIDLNGNVYKSDYSNGQVVFHKLFTAREPITQFDFITNRNAIITFHASGKIYLTSLEGVFLSEQEISENNCLAVKSSADGSKIYASFKNGKIRAYSTNPSNFLIEISSFDISQWPVSLDYESGLIAVGTTGGSINIYTSVGTYKTKIDAIVNFIQILPENLPKITLAIGTHGGGIRIISALDMKLN
jgi:hypothetical protein